MAEQMARATVQCMARRHAAERVIWRIGVITLMVIAQVTLSTLALASPADPSWIAGIYDDADYDDVVALATAETGSITPAVRAVSRLDLPLIGQSYDRDETAFLVRSASVLRSRAPPAA